MRRRSDLTVRSVLPPWLGFMAIAATVLFVAVPGMRTPWDVLGLSSFLLICVTCPTLLLVGVWAEKHAPEDPEC